MKHLSILVPQGQNNLSSVVGPLKIFSRANTYFEQKGRERVFEIELVGTSDKVDYYQGLFTVNTEKNIVELDKTDLIVIPSLNHDYASALAGNERLITWICGQYNAGAEIASICTGAFLLAASGILDGRSCSTHWAAAEDFRKKFPKVKLQSERLITDENGIYTNGGAYSFLNLMLYLVEKHYDRDTAIYCSKVFQIDPRRNLQSEFAIFNGHKKHDDGIVQMGQKYLEEHYGEKISIETLTQKLHVGRRNFDRRFKKATDFTPLEYLQGVRIEAAKRAFENTGLNSNEVMYDVGYNDSKAFREVFVRITGITPLAYKNRYNKDRPMGFAQQ